MEKEIETTLQYFLQFQYAPTSDEIFTFLSKKTKKNYFNRMLNDLMNKKHIISLAGNPNRYTLRGYNFSKKTLKTKTTHAQIKLTRIKHYIDILKYFSSIQLIGISGSLAMHSAKRNDDIDLFIIAREHRLWTARFIANALAYFMGKKRPRKRRKTNTRDMLCLNMFIDTNSLQMPPYKQNKYIAHEILQMKPLVNKNGIYEKFLHTNKWIYDLYPNNSYLSASKKNHHLSSKIAQKVGNGIEKVLKYVQLKYMSPHRKNERILKGQLWFHPNDFEAKIRF